MSQKLQNSRLGGSGLFIVVIIIISIFSLAMMGSNFWQPPTNPWGCMNLSYMVNIFASFTFLQWERVGK